MRVEPLEDERVVARAVLERLEHARRAPDAVQVLLAWVVGRRVALRENRDDRGRQVVDVLDQRDGLLASHVERGDGAGEEDRVADGEDRQLIPELDRLRRPGDAWRLAGAFFSDIASDLDGRSVTQQREREHLFRSA